MKFGISFGASSWDLGKFLNPITEKVQGPFDCCCQVTQGVFRYCERKLTGCLWLFILIKWLSLNTEGAKLNESSE